MKTFYLNNRRFRTAACGMVVVNPGECPGGQAAINGHCHFMYLVGWMEGEGTEAAVEGGPGRAGSRPSNTIY